MAIKVNVLRREAPKRAAGGLSVPKFSLPTGRALPIVGLLAVIVIVGLIVWAVIATRAKGQEQAEIKKLKAQDQALQLQLTELKLADAARKEITRRLDIVGRVAKSQKVPVQVMNGILRSVPQGIWLTSVDVKPQEVKVKVDANRPAISYSSETLTKLANKKEEVGAKPSGPAAATKEVTEIHGYSVVLKGLAFNNFQVAEFMENLRKAGVFSDVDFNVTQAQAIEAVRVMDFEVTASVKL